MDTHIVVTHGAAHGGRMKYCTLFHVCAAITLLALLIPGVLPAGPSAQPAEAAQHVAAAPLSFPGPATGHFRRAQVPTCPRTRSFEK